MKTLTINGLDLHAPDTHGNTFNIRRYYEKIHNMECSSINIVEGIELDVLEYFFENYTFISHSTYNLSIEGIDLKKTSKNFYEYMSVKRKPTYSFKHKDYIIIANIVDRLSKDNTDIDDDWLLASSNKDATSTTKYVNKNNSKIFLTIFYPSNLVFDQIGEEFGFLEKYKIVEKEKDYVSVLIKNQYGEYDFEPLNIKVPKMKLDLNYGEKFTEIYKKIVNKLKNNNKGLYMFHGDPGTGKSSFIKHLTTVVKKEFIFIPTSFIEKFISDPDIFAILIRKKNCVLILEDAEKVLVSREKEDNQFISTLLNISDGILSDILEASVILTYNCDDTKIDKALKRKGRTMVDYRFDSLSIEDSKKLATHLKIKKEDIENIKEPMTLSEIYNFADDNKFYEEENKNDKKIIGFGKA
jgi:hypothetical protein